MSTSTTESSKYFKHLISHDNAFRTNILSRFPDLMITMRVPPEARNIIKESVFELLNTDHELLSIFIVYQKYYKLLKQFASTYNNHQNDSKRKFLDKADDFLQTMPKYFNSITKDPTAQKDLFESKTVLYLKQLSKTGKSADECRLALGKKDGVFYEKTEMKKFQEQVEGSLEFLSEVTKCLKKNLDQLIKVPCVPIFLKTVKDADVLDGLNRYPELKKIIAKTRGNIKNPKKHFNYFVSGIAEFQKATDSIIPTGGYWIMMDEDIVMRSSRYNNFEKMVLMRSEVNEKNLRESNADKLAFRLRKLAILEWNLLSQKMKNTIELVENARDDLRQFTINLLNAEHDWFLQFKEHKKVKILPEFECPFLVDYDYYETPEEMQREINGATIDVITLMIDILRETKPELKHIILPIQEDLVRSAKETANVTEWLYNNWEALSPQATAQPSVSAGISFKASCNEPAGSRGSDEALCDLGQIQTLRRGKNIETIVLSSDSEEPGEEKKENEKKKPEPVLHLKKKEHIQNLRRRNRTNRTTGSQKSVAKQNLHSSAISPQITAHVQLPQQISNGQEHSASVKAVSAPHLQFNRQANHPNQGYPIYFVHEKKEEPVDAHLIPPPLQPEERETYARILPHRDAPPPPVEKASSVPLTHLTFESSAEPTERRVHSGNENEKHVVTKNDEMNLEKTLSGPNRTMQMQDSISPHQSASPRSSPNPLSNLPSCLGSANSDLAHPVDSVHSQSKVKQPEQTVVVQDVKVGENQGVVRKFKKKKSRLFAVFVDPVQTQLQVDQPIQTVASQSTNVDGTSKAEQIMQPQLEVPTHNNRAEPPTPIVVQNVEVYKVQRVAPEPHVIKNLLKRNGQKSNRNGQTLKRTDKNDVEKTIKKKKKTRRSLPIRILRSIPKMRIASRKKLKTAKNTAKQEHIFQQFLSATEQPEEDEQTRRLPVPREPFIRKERISTNRPTVHKMPRVATPAQSTLFSN